MADTDVRDRAWRLIREQSWSGAMNMALDEIAAETAADGGPRTVRVYRWNPSTLSLGYRQDPDTVDWAFCEREGIEVTRRQTGGGGIYHDTNGDISYSIVAPKDELPSSLMDCYHLLCTPVLDAFERMGVAADFAEDELPEIYHPACYLRELHPAHDIVADGRKISGNAQYRRKNAVIQHGSLTYSVDAERHLSTFTGHDVSPETFRERVTGIDEESETSRSEAVAAVERALADWAAADDGSWTDDELERARERAAEKYADDDWVRRRPDER
ncbi:lipoate--protein ligase family protein [Halogranum rubrum]|uniref:Lipoate-protein ligase a n=1 Tax=Halogranum salarium B-1 TaxID=1210908 RepID=J3JHD4_9EURY|nr:biotin/lipoate A/B protein ligase family protein [Halogranum salarium]EJN60894.1 lipoate-protein ligase a [Halogranum salarium B-1]